MTQLAITLSVTAILFCLWVFWYAQGTNEVLKAHRDNDQQHKLLDEIRSTEATMYSDRLAVEERIRSLAAALGMKWEPGQTTQGRWIKRGKP